MKMLKIQGPTKVDSTRLSIPLFDCKVIDTNLIDPIIRRAINTNTGEIIQSEEKPCEGIPTQITNNDGTYIKFWIEKQFYYTQEGAKEHTDFITFLVNSKHLKERYFEGITLDTLPTLYEYLMSYKIIEFNYQSLLNARYNDIDICVDFKSTPEHFDVLKNELRALSSSPEHWHTATGQKDNSGTWTPIRQEPRKQATPGKPFIKFYSKEEDFNNKSRIFAQTYIETDLYKDLYRVEATIKNSRHKVHLGISEAKTFGAFLHLDLQLLLQELVNEYFKNETKLVMKSGQLTPIELVIVDLMNELTKKGATNNELFVLFNRSDVSRQAKKGLKEKYYKLTALDEFNRKQLDLNSASSDLFSYLNISH